MKIMIIVFGILASTLNIFSQSSLDSNRTMLQNFVLCECLAQQYDSGVYNQLNEGSSAVYLNKFEYVNPLELFEASNEFIGNYKWNMAGSKTGKNLGIARCLELYNSKELEEFIAQMDRYLPK